jgi:hypothetical protein
MNSVGRVEGQSDKDKGQSKTESDKYGPNFVLSSFPVDLSLVLCPLYFIVGLRTGHDCQCQFLRRIVLLIPSPLLVDWTHGQEREAAGHNCLRQAGSQDSREDPRAA